MSAYDEKLVNVLLPSDVFDRRTDIKYFSEAL